MTTDTRDRIIVTTARLLAQRGLEGTSFADVLDAAQAPRGSLYYHFPGGKDQLIAEAIDLAGRVSLRQVDGLEGQMPEAITGRFLDGWRELLLQTQCQAGCAVLAVTVATDSAEVRQHANAIFASWIERLTELFVAGGVNFSAASDFATTLIAASEGAVAMSRAQGNVKPFEVVATQLLGQARTLHSSNA